MKTLVMIICMAVSAMGFAFEDKNKTGTVIQTDQEQPKMINKETLPKTIIDAFNPTGDYEEWAIENAYSVTTTRDGREKADYLIHAKKEDPTEGIYEEAVFYFDKKGKMVKQDKIDKDWPGTEDKPDI